MASTPLRLFPTISTERPLKSALRRPRTSNSREESNDLKGVPPQVTTDNKSKAHNAAPESITHSLFCDPSPEILASIAKRMPEQQSSDEQSSSSPAISRPEVRLRNRSAGAHHSPLTGSELSSDLESDETSSHTYPTRGPSAPATKRAPRPKQRKVPAQLSVSAQIASTQPSWAHATQEDQLSPLPHKTQFTPRLRQSNETPSSASDRTTSPLSTRSVTPSFDAYPKTKNDFPPMRSIFPQYDHNKPLSQQQYFPRVVNQPVSTMSEQGASKIGGPGENRSLKRFDSAVGLFDGYEHVPAADPTDLQNLWNASCDELLVDGRKVQLNLLQFSAQGTALAIGRNGDELLYCMDRIDTQSIQQNPSHPKEMAVKKHHPTQKSSLPVAHLLLPDRTSIRTAGKPLTSIFPQAAAIDAIESLLTTSKAKEIESLDGGMRSPTAARFANDAIAAAQDHHCCTLVRKVRRRDSLGSVTAAYDLRHPKLGTFVINVTKSYAPTSPTIPRAKISLHHPSATLTAVAAETLNLAFLDFARDACVLDLPGLLALDDRYVVDTVVTALLAVAVIENDTLVAEALVFDAPPKVAISDAKKDRGIPEQEKSALGSRFSRRRGRSKKKSKKSGRPQDDEQVELPLLTQGALALLGLSFKAAVLLLNTGVKVTAGVIVGASNAARKL